MAYTDESLAAAGAAVDRLDSLLGALAGYRQEGPSDPTLGRLLDDTRAGFDEAIDDDLNISAALAALFEGVRELNRRIDARLLSSADAVTAAAFIHDLDRVLSVTADREAEHLEAGLQALLDARSAARTARNWAESDRLRDELATRGVAVEDTRDGQRWRRLTEAGRG